MFSDNLFQSAGPDACAVSLIAIMLTCLQHSHASGAGGLSK